MVAAIDFAVRDFAGGSWHGSVAGGAQSSIIQINSGDSVSLNLSRGSIVAYEQRGGDLLITLADGRTIVLSGYFYETPGDVNHLYLSADGEIVEVFLDDSDGGLLFANYGQIEGWATQSPLNELTFAGSDMAQGAVMAANAPAGMAAFVPGLLAGFGGVGTAAAAIGGGAVVLGGIGGGSKTASPTVDPQTTTTVTTNTTAPALSVSGTGEPGETVAVSIGDKTQTTTIATDGKWAVSFPANALPADGSHIATVIVTDAGGATTTLTGPAFVLDLTPPEVSARQGVKAAGDVENAAEYQNGVSINGRGEPGSTITVQIGSHSQAATVATNGSWAVTFPQNQIAAGDYEVPVRITATDLLGNQTTLDETLVIDTVPHPIGFNAVTTDNLVSLTETQSGLFVSGTSTAGATMSVTLQGITRIATVSLDGTWSVTYPAGTLASGEYSATLTATTTDAAGNVSTATHAFLVDTLARVGLDGNVAGDNVINAVEAAAGLTVTGTVEPGSSVVARFASGAFRSAAVGPDGTWTVAVPSEDIPAGENTVPLTITATDRFGNTTTLTETVQIDTTLRDFAPTGGSVGGDGLVNGIEAAAGLTFTGTAEPGATVVLQFPSGTSLTTTASTDGTWSATFAAADVPRGEMASSVSVTATDRAGNVSSFSHDFVIDTVAPGAPDVTMVVKTTQGTLRGIYTEATGDAFSFHEVKADGSTLTVAETHATQEGETAFAFNRGVPDGSYLVVNTADAAGNESSMLLIVNNTVAPVVDLNRAGLAGFDLSAIDLTVAPQASLSITEAQLNAITGPDHSLVIKGGADDHVTLLGGIATTESRLIDGQAYRLYHLGAGGSLYVDDDILTQTSAVI